MRCGAAAVALSRPQALRPGSTIWRMARRPAVARGADQHKNPQSDIEIAQAAAMRPIGEIAAKLGIPDEALSPYGRFKAKVGLDYVASLDARPNGKLIL